MGLPHILEKRSTSWKPYPKNPSVAHQSHLEPEKAPKVVATRHTMSWCAVLSQPEVQEWFFSQGHPSLHLLALLCQKEPCHQGSRTCAQTHGPLWTPLQV